MARNRKPKGTKPLVIATCVWLFLALFTPLYETFFFWFSAGVSFILFALFKSMAKSADRSAEEQRRAEEIRNAQVKPQYTSQRVQNASQPQYTSQRVQQRQQGSTSYSPTQAQAPKKSYGPEVDPIVEEGNRALSEMGRLYLSIKDPEVRIKINEIMRITDKITQDAIADPSDIPQIRKFMNYYLPTTIKLLNAYDRMSAQGIEGENLDKTMKSINTMLDDAIVAYKKMLDSLFANQALDIETDIQVMNTMLAREGLSGGKDFEVSSSAGT